MNKKKLIRIVLLICAVIIASASIVTLMITPQTLSAALYNQVCCGSMCGGMDYCIGSGKYICCIPRE